MPRVSRVRSLGKYFLLLDNLLVVLGFFVVFPLISIRFVDQLGWAALMVGLALGLRQFLQQGLGIFGGALADRFGAKPLIVTGMLLRAAGFATMALADQPWILIFSCALSAFGGTLFDPPRVALVIKLTRPHERGRFYSLLMMQDSAGVVIGALLGSWLLRYDFHWVCWFGAAFFVLAAALNAFVLPAYRVSTSVRAPIMNGIKAAVKDSYFRRYVLTLTGYYVLSIQVMLMLPLLVNEVSGAPETIRWMYLIQAILSLSLLYPIARWSEKYFRLDQRLMVGLLLMTFSLMPLGFVHSLSGILALIFFFYLGLIIAEPARETLSASLSNPHARASYMGFSKLGLAFGGAIGYTGGGWLYDIGHEMNLPEIPWLLLGVVGIITALALHRQFSPGSMNTKAMAS
ncbi:multidrug efflux MFS transporter MdtH [Budviciaceae bacterium CWB-B4]|uniref:Multidrug resistance protein MdtH n=1 Tax=Limnobaculum xujianqingii TaxID=2738837 RepID=A0A9D7FSH1_9GAMM|nr:multidrug efflux MFS transporter MdtH [Limnobaculum xujianqingii]MBK5072733.1 multidrug efflux MFS transporter MdtH [Limnobaculum xujianqingii]MBK5176042.1 multidrug efflux MFS transporter MdtH [Limnobaculum xujianqingii]